MKKSWNNPLLIFVKYFLFKSRSKSWLKVARVVNLKLAFTEWFFYNLVILIKLCKIRYLWNKHIILADAYLNNFIFVTVWNKVTAVWNKNLLYIQMKTFNFSEVNEMDWVMPSEWHSLQPRPGPPCPKTLKLWNLGNSAEDEYIILT